MKVIITRTALAAVLTDAHPCPRAGRQWSVRCAIEQLIAGVMCGISGNMTNIAQAFVVSR